MPIITRTDDGRGSGWRIADPVLRLRGWGTTLTRLLPVSPPSEALIVGTNATCWLQLLDPLVSKEHAKLSQVDGRWLISDMQSKNGLWQDGVRRVSFALEPGVEIGMGDLTLIPESAQLMALREILARLIGWNAARANEVDLALRVLRTTATRRESLLLCGEGDLISIARLLHRHALGSDRPFVVCDPRRRRADPNVRAAANYDSGLAALEAATGGTLCVWKDRQPSDFAAVVAAIREPTSRAQLIVCTHALDHGEPLIAQPIVLPPLVERTSELDQIIDAYGADAVALLGGVFTASDRAWIRKEECASLAQIDKAARRLVAYRASNRSITRAAKMLDMSHGAYSEWIARRTMPE